MLNTDKYRDTVPQNSQMPEAKTHHVCGKAYFDNCSWIIWESSTPVNIYRKTCLMDIQRMPIPREANHTFSRRSSSFSMIGLLLSRKADSYEAKTFELELQRWLHGEEFPLLLQKTKIWFQSPTWWFTTIFNSRTRESHALFWPPWSTYICAGKRVKFKT